MTNIKDFPVSRMKKAKDGGNNYTIPLEKLASGYINAMVVRESVRNSVLRCTRDHLFFEQFSVMIAELSTMTTNFIGFCDLVLTDTRESGSKHIAIDPDAFVYYDDMFQEMVRKNNIISDRASNIDRMHSVISEFVLLDWIKSVDPDRHELLDHEKNAIDASIRRLVNAVHRIDIADLDSFNIGSRKDQDRWSEMHHDYAINAVSGDLGDDLSRDGYSALFLIQEDIIIAIKERIKELKGEE